jgi:hypothetical protein
MKMIKLIMLVCLLGASGACMAGEKDEECGFYCSGGGHPPPPKPGLVIDLGGVL